MVQSNKGERHLTRPARRKGWVPAARRPAFVATLFAIDQAGATASVVLPERQIFDRPLQAALVRSLDPGFRIVACRSRACTWERVTYENAREMIRAAARQVEGESVSGKAAPARS
jgi:hypothetical protein